MIKRDYTEEIDMSTKQRVIPKRYVLPVVVTVLAVSVWLGFKRTDTTPAHGAKPAAVAPGK